MGILLFSGLGSLNYFVLLDLFDFVDDLNFVSVAVFRLEVLLAELHECG
jgi:hypothetical protein